MENEFLAEELSMMYEEELGIKPIDTSIFQQPIKHLRAKKPLTLTADRTAGEAIKLMRERNVGCVLITKNEKLEGIFTERDVLLRVAGLAGAESRKLGELMKAGVETFQPEDSLAFVMNAMHVGGYRHVPVVDAEGHPIGVASIRDIVRFILDHFPESVLNLPPRPVRTTVVREGA